MREPRGGGQGLDFFNIFFLAFGWNLGYIPVAFGTNSLRIGMSIVQIS